VVHARPRLRITTVSTKRTDTAPAKEALYNSLSQVYTDTPATIQEGVGMKPSHQTLPQANRLIPAPEQTLF
jgi:hypothetical protein